MGLGRIACAVGRHTVDESNVKRAGGQQVGRCRNCRAAMEEVEPNYWALQRVKDAGLGRRAFF